VSLPNGKEAGLARGRGTDGLVSGRWMGSESGWMETLVAGTERETHRERDRDRDGEREKDLGGRAVSEARPNIIPLLNCLDFRESSTLIICIDFIPIRQQHVWY
jgi:hypothetical protein